MVNRCLRRATILLFFTFIILIISPLSQGAEKTFPLEKIKPGMTGYGYTVFSGTKIEKFDVKVLGLSDSNFNNDKLILVKLSGKQIEQGGGLAAGMSGSPVYLDDKLVGAISYGFENADPSLALVTPIESMLKLFSSPGKIVEFKNFNLKLVPIVTPVIVAGMGKRGYESISRLLQSYGLKTVYIPSQGPSLGSPDFEMGKGLIRPGSAIAVMMVAGDYQVSAIGTVTFVDEKKFLAFGHSYTNQGDTNYLAFLANILHTVKSSVMSFKVGSPIKLIGEINQDRQAGIAGQLEEAPEMIPVQISVKDQERNVVRNNLFKVVANQQIWSDLITTGVTDTIDQTIDRVGAGTARVTVKISTNDERFNVVRENLYYGKDIAVSSIKDLHDLLEILTKNEFDAVSIKSIQIDVAVKAKQESARILKLESETTSIKPGETLKVNAHLHCYRGDDLVIPLVIKLPSGIKPGKLTINAFGGLKDADNEDEDSKKETYKIDYKEVDSLKSLLAKYLSSPKNNDLVLEYNPSIEQKEDSRSKNNAEKENPIQLKFNTNYYLFGGTELTIEVVQP